MLSPPLHPSIPSTDADTLGDAMSIATVRGYWDEAERFIAALSPPSPLTTPTLVEYLNRLLPSDCERATRTKINYLRKQDILHPMVAGGDERKSWRYTPNDV